MDKWDNKETSDSKKKSFSNTAMLVLLGMVIAMWVILGVTTLYLPENNITCDSINEYVGSIEFYEMTNDDQQMMLDAQNRCNPNNIIVR